ncbi:MAG: hypothetical protein HYZ53_15575 [Planctomycetes bacterium]|nr:hypothetical protein [Planctomycetota bacterium]
MARKRLLLALVLAMATTVGVLRQARLVHGDEPPVANPPAPGPAAPAAPEKSPDELVAERLKVTKVTLNFNDAPFSDVLAFLREFTQFNLLFDEGLRHAKPPVSTESLRVTVKLQDLAMESVLALVTKMHGLDYKVVWGCVLVSTPERLKTLPGSDWCAASKEDSPARQKTVEQLQKLRLDLDFTDATIDDMLEFVQEFAKLKVALAGQGEEHPKLTFQARAIALRDLFTLFGLFLDAEPQVLEDAVVLRVRPPQKEK